MVKMRRGDRKEKGLTLKRHTSYWIDAVMCLCSFYAQLRKEEEERQQEWAKKYRDRARERRDGQNPDYEVSEDAMPATSGYRAVAPNIEP